MPGPQTRIGNRHSGRSIRHRANYISVEKKYSSKLCLAGCFRDVTLIVSGVSSCARACLDVPFWNAEGTVRSKRGRKSCGDLLSYTFRYNWAFRWLLGSNLYDCICICMSTEPLLRLGKVILMPFGIASSPKSLDWRHRNSLNAIG
jgi:hypothetical protein